MSSLEWALTQYDWWGFLVLGGVGLVLFLWLVLSFLGLHSQHVEVPGLGVELELQLPAYTTATATQDLHHICNRHHSSWQDLNPLSKAKDQIHILMDPCQVRYS